VKTQRKIQGTYDDDDDDDEGNIADVGTAPNEKPDNGMLRSA
jgi:hypothetical protein